MLKSSSRGSQDGAKDAPRGRQDAPRRAQDAPKRPPRAPKTPMRAIFGRFLVEFGLMFRRFFDKNSMLTSRGSFLKKALKPNEKSKFFWFSGVEVGTKIEQTSIGKSRPRRDVSFCNPKTPQEATKTPQDAPKTPQDAPKTRPRRPKTPPRRAQDAPRRAQDAPKTPQGGPKRRTRRPKTSQDAGKKG